MTKSQKETIVWHLTHTDKFDQMISLTVNSDKTIKIVTLEFIFNVGIRGGLSDEFVKPEKKIN